MNGKGSSPRKNADRKSYDKNYQKIKWGKDNKVNEMWIFSELLKYFKKLNIINKKGE